MRARYWIFLMVLLVLPLASAATFNCTIRASASCNAGETVFIRLNSSEAGAAPNNSHAQMPNTSTTQYSYTVCCSTDAFRTLSNTCSATSTTVLKLQNDTNSHVQAGTQSGYTYTACLNVTAGNISCEYPNSACSAGYSPVLSIASSEAADSNLTNAHVADFSFYQRKVCCQIGGQNPPVVAWANVSPNPTATTRDDLLCNNGSVTDIDGDTVTLHYNWYRNGTSITVLNLPMDYDSTNGVTHDISGYNNHGTVSGATFLPTGDGGGLSSYIGGQFLFQGGNITVPTSQTLNFTTNDFSIAVYVQRETTPATSRILGTVNGSGYGGFSLHYIDALNTRIVFSVANETTIASTTFLIGGGGYYVVTKNASHIALYRNGVLQRTTQIDPSFNVVSPRPLTIGDTEAGNYLNGTIDELIIFNRSLNATEISALYNMYNKNLSGTELRRNDFWNCSITPVDSTGLNGTTKYSNQTNISGSPPLAVTLLYPANGNTTVFERYVNFSWSAADERDGDQVNYTLNATVEPGTCSVQTTQSNILTTNYTYGELCTDQYYNWTIRACDIDGCSSLSTQFNFTIASVLSITLLNNNTNFGTLDILQSKDTETGGVTPYLLENNGNVLANVSLNASSSPFATVGLGNSAFQYKARANESSAFNSSGSPTTYTTVDAALKNVLKQLNYTDTRDAAYIDINITVPGAEPPGSKTTNVTFRAVRDS